MIDHIQLISVGDMIEAINGQSLLGCRHYEVARLLKELPRGRTFTLRLTEPRKAFGERGAAGPGAARRWRPSATSAFGEGHSSARAWKGFWLSALPGGTSRKLPRGHLPGAINPAKGPQPWPAPQLPGAGLGCPTPAPHFSIRLH